MTCNSTVADDCLDALLDRLLDFKPHSFTFCMSVIVFIKKYLFALNFFTFCLVAPTNTFQNHPLPVSVFLISTSFTFVKVKFLLILHCTVTEL